MEYVRLGDVCRVVSGSTPKSEVAEFWDGTIKWITPAEIHDDTYIVMDTERHITKRAIEKTHLTLLPVGTVLLSSRAPIGKTAIVGAEMYCNQGFKNLICSDRIFNRYLYFFLTARTNYLNDLGRGATFKEISKTIVENIEIPLPELDGQKKIVARLEKIEVLMVNRKKVIAWLKKIVQARFVEMFGDPVTNPKKWPVVLLRDIASSRLGKMLDQKQETGMHAHPYLANFNVQWFSLRLDKLNEMDFDETEQQEFELRTGDLLVCEGGEVGRCAIWKNEIPNCYFQKALHRVRCDTSKILPEYLEYAFFFHAQYNGFQDVMSGVSTIAHLPGAQLKKIPVIAPPLPLQQKFAAFVRQADAARCAAEAQFSALATLRAKVLQDAFGA